ncbi:recombinase family protein [Streptomyces sp. Ncost-T10-10d]|uniref:recombinase family protein n=1 Tax=Streptomyces sp. Ncost-T10-10d TaxID=1839774 RepID=UPI00352127A4
MTTEGARLLQRQARAGARPGAAPSVVASGLRAGAGARGRCLIGRTSIPCNVEPMRERWRATPRPRAGGGPARRTDRRAPRQLQHRLQDLISIATDLLERGVGFGSLDDSLETSNAGGRLVLRLFGASAAFLRELIIEGTNEGPRRGQRLPPARRWVHSCAAPACAAGCHTVILRPVMYYAAVGAPGARRLPPLCFCHSR